MVADGFHCLLQLQNLYRYGEQNADLILPNHLLLAHGCDGSFLFPLRRFNWRGLRAVLHITKHVRSYPIGWFCAGTRRN
jgi:hypothetical protein